LGHTHNLESEIVVVVMMMMMMMVMMMMMMMVMMMMMMVMINNNHNNDGYVYIYKGGLTSEIGVGELSMFIPCCTWSISMWVWFNIMKTYLYNTVVKYKTSWGLINIYIYVYMYIYIYGTPPPKKNYLFTIFTGICGVFRLNFCDSNKRMFKHV